jgi:hypothetical protein
LRYGGRRVLRRKRCRGNWGTHNSRCGRERERESKKKCERERERQQKRHKREGGATKREREIRGRERGRRAREKEMVVHRLLLLNLSNQHQTTINLISLSLLSSKKLSFD